MPPDNSLIVTVDGAAVRADEIGPPAMNYGQLHRWAGRPRLSYRYEMPIAFFIERAGLRFDRYREETRADDRGFPPDAGSTDAEFAALGYPPLAALVKDHPRLAERLWLVNPLDLNNLLDFAGAETVRYSANSVDFVTIADDKVAFGGVAFDVKPAGG